MHERRPGPKPKRLYLRTVRALEPGPISRAERKVGRAFVQNLERVGRLVAEGDLTDPAGHCLIFRAEGREEAERILRTDPWRDGDPPEYRVSEWDPQRFGGGVNLEPAPALGSGRLTALHRVAVVVQDQPAALEWYREVLGLKVREDDSDTGFVELSLGRGTAGLSLVSPRPEWGEPYFSEARARIGRATGIVFQTDSVTALELRLRHAGAEVTEPPKPQPWGGQTIRFCDPDGNEYLAFETGALRPAPKIAVRVTPTAARGGPVGGGGRLRESSQPKKVKAGRLPPTRRP
ncbi:MAG TPA: VOC family protein [Thermoplasmata archaeon]|nr:VOC family protein [Thermoplasmata archaeon]